MSPHKHWQPLLIDDVSIHPGSVNENREQVQRNTFLRKALDQEPVKEGELTESPDSNLDNRSRNLTDATMGSPAFLVDDVEVGNSCHIGVRTLQIHLRDEMRIH